MPQNIETHPLALRAITSIFDTTLKPLYAHSGDFFWACFQDVYPSNDFPAFKEGFNVEAPIWKVHSARVSTNLFGMTGDVLMWLPAGWCPAGFVAIRTPEQKVVTSIPEFTFTNTGRLQLHISYLRVRPDIVLRFAK